ncbi:hypothetical protein GCM10017772_06880 [Promicromonospora soli]|uniref:Uncharacterized protein n=1 Tax=Promicromonospora soli TaxID=2035533 RepID=A0A919FKE3_9MICO|nr:hypothetical protein GCM10017772_06880 [Promicromonospora soli]
MRVWARAPDRATGKFDDMGVLQVFEGNGSQNLSADGERAPGISRTARAERGQPSSVPSSEDDGL